MEYKNPGAGLHELQIVDYHCKKINKLVILNFFAPKLPQIKTKPIYESMICESHHKCGENDEYSTCLYKSEQAYQDLPKK